MTRAIATRTRAEPRWVVPVLGLILIVQGCAGLIPGKDSATGDLPGGGGAFQVRKGRPGIVIGAPPGASDADTDAVARELARRTGFGLVVSRSSASRQQSDEDVQSALHAYRRLVVDAGQGPLRLYVEVHGNGDRASAGRVQIATTGLGPDDAWRLKTLFELIRDARVEKPTPRLEMVIESRTAGLQTVQVSAPAGALGASRALHIDLPRAARTTYRENYTNVLAAFLTESATVLVARER
jgi:hypothetical protein